MKLLHETSLALILGALLVVLLNPFNILMPEQFEMLCLGLIVLFFIVFVWYLLEERVLDEREELHRFIAGRFAYIAGMSVLVLGIIVQAWMDHLNFWLPLAFGGMLLAKLCGKWYANWRY